MIAHPGNDDGVHVAVVHSSSAGDEVVTEDDLRNAIDRAGHTIDYRSIDDDGWEACLGVGHDLVVAAGGDGTVSRVFGALAGTASQATILALGTANNVARTLEIPVDDPLRWIDYWSVATTRPFDVPTIATASTRLPVIEGVSGGLFALLLAAAESEPGDEDDVDDDRIWERFLRVVADAPVEHWRLELDDDEVSGPYLGVQLMNICETMSQLDIAPDADPSDALLDVVLIREADREALIAYGERRRDGGDHPAPRFESVRARTIAGACRSDCPVAVDDRPWAVEPAAGAITVAVGATQLPVLVPEGTHRRTTGYGTTR